MDADEHRSECVAKTKEITPGLKRFLWNSLCSRILAAEVGHSGIRVICLRPDAIPEALNSSHLREVFNGVAERFGTTVEAMLTERARTGTLVKRFPTLAEVANYAAFVASDRASAMTGAIASLTCG